MIVVTGGAGFIGSCILAKLNEQGHNDIIVVDHIEQGNIKSRNLENKKYIKYFDKGEFLQRVLDNQLDEKITCIIHMGACSSTTLEDAEYYQKNNFEYTQHLAQWALKHETRFIYASSAATYGDGSLGYLDAEEMIPRLKPLNLYGDSKQKFDQWVLDEGLIQKIVGLKFFNVFGPNEYHKGDMRSVVVKAYKQVMEEGKIRLFKSYKSEYMDGEQKRDFIYVKDAVDVVMRFFENSEVTGIYNVGTGVARSWNDLAHSLFAALEKPPKIEYIDMPEKMRPRYQYFTQADVCNLRSSGYTKTFMSLEESVKDYVSYLKTNRCI